MKRLEFNCANGDDRIAVNDFLVSSIRKLRRRNFRLVSETNDDGSFEIRITGQATSPAEPQEAIREVAEPTKVSRKRKRKAELIEEAPTEQDSEPLQPDTQEEDTAPE